MQPVPQDTPVHRATISELTLQQLEELIDGMRERRMRQQKLWEEAQQAKAKIKEEKDKARYQHVLEMVEKRVKSVDSGLEALSKYLNELKVLQLVCGD